MNKKQWGNWIMAGIIILIVAAGIAAVGNLKGWFDRNDGTAAVLQDVQGTIQLYRDGVSCPVDGVIVLRAGDRLSCQPGATGKIVIGTDYLYLGEGAEVTIGNAGVDSFCLQTGKGSVFAHCENSARMQIGDKDLPVAQATALISVENNAMSLWVFRGTVDSVAAGQSRTGSALSAIDLRQLSDFAITRLQKYEGAALCVTTTDLQELEKQKQQAMQELIDNQVTAPTEATQSQTATQTPAPPTESTQPTTPEQPARKTCTIAIYCDTIHDNMHLLEPGKMEFVPDSGVILYPVTVQFTEGETVFDILKRTCAAAGIQLEYSWTPIYNSYYVEGIHHLYEFDCGFESGWMYKVNGWFPNYGCSSYQVQDGDTIVWAYTCVGLGMDLGANMR